MYLYACIYLRPVGISIILILDVYRLGPHSLIVKGDASTPFVVIPAHIT